MVSSVCGKRCEDRGPLVPLGRVVSAHGVRGEVLLRPYNSDTDLPRPRMDVVLMSPDGTRTDAHVRSVRRSAKGIILTLAGVDDRTAAERLRGRDLSVPRSALPPPGEGEYYWVDVIGVAVRVEGGDEIGRVASVFRSSTDVLVVRGAAGEWLVPVVEGFVLGIGPDGVVLAPSAIEEAVT